MELKDNKLCEGKKELTLEELEQVTGGADLPGGRDSIIYNEITDVLFGDVISTSTGQPTIFNE